MCCHRLFVFSVCGHSTLSERPLQECSLASIPPESRRSIACDPIAHPYRSWKLDRLCPACQARRDSLLGGLEASLTVSFDQWRWKVSYGMPAHGKDYWGRKAEEREREERERRSQEKRASWRFGLRRRRPASKG